ncbi:uncharacterized protein LOC119399203 [Rhipicephalus sanguineus]|uniref:uncharacterized protein LOC119399203 n=1 Tax=Rhipicephalus sanguineus TaxID=34632 RepID=UPI0020C4E9B1|nr:uncharacterized protein LOC119399203 [Rhipicephalus sanguineus]
MAKRRISLGLFLRTSNDVELTLSPNRVATFRVSGGVLDFFIFFGATPTEVVAQYTRFVGLPAMPSLRFIENGTPTSTDRIVLPFSMPVKEESGPKLEQRLLDLTHPAAEHEWTKMMDTLQAFENLRTTDVMWLEAVSCLNGTSEALECPEDSRTFPCNECSGTPKLHLSQYSDVRNAYGYLMARMAHRVMAPKLGAYPALATSNDTFPGIGKWNVLWNLAPGQGVKGLKRAVRDIQLYSILGLPYFIMSLCPVEAVSNNTALPPVPLSSGSCIKTTNLSLWLSLAAFLPIMQHLNTSTRLDVSRRAASSQPQYTIYAWPTSDGGSPDSAPAPYATLSERNTRFRFFYARNFLAGYCSPCVHGDVLGSVTILGLTKAPSRVEFNGEELAFSIDKQALMVESAYHVLTKPFVMKLI